MELTSSQRATLKAAILADANFNTLPVDNGSALFIAEALNQPAQPSFVVWKKYESIANIGKVFNAAELATRSQADNIRLQTIAVYFSAGVNPSTQSIRTAFDDIFSGTGGVQTRAALLALWKRSTPANRVEKLFAVGLGTDASPGTLLVEGTLTYIDVVRAMGWPE